MSAPQTLQTSLEPDSRAVPERSIPGRHSPELDLSERQRRSLGEASTITRSCPLCTRDNTAEPPHRFSLGTWRLKECNSCGFVYLENAPDYAALRESMAWEKTTQVEEAWRDDTRGLNRKISKKLRWRMRLLPRKTMVGMVRRHAQPGNVIDLGCGSGDQLNDLSPGYVPFGIEISTSLAARADPVLRSRAGRVVNAPCLDGLDEFSAGFFSAATLRSYLEHELFPAEVLRKLYGKLAPTGIFLVKVPNYASLNRKIMGRKWPGFRHPDHLNYFTPESLRRVAEACGFGTYFGKTYKLPTSDNMWAVLWKRRSKG